MVGTLLKILGVVVLIGGVLGIFVGGFTILYGEMQATDSDDGLLFTDARQAREGEAAKEAGVAVVGGSFLFAGLGLALLVAGIAIGGSERSGKQQQQQQVVVVPGPPRTD